MSTQVGIYGIGHFGYAILQHLATQTNGRFALRAFDRDDQVRSELRERRAHPFHQAAAPLASEVRIVDTPGELLQDLDVLVLAVTSNSTREVIDGLLETPWSRTLTIINTAKALDFKTGRLLGDIIGDRLEAAAMPFVYGALAGGTIAADLLERDPLGVTIGCANRERLDMVTRLFHTDRMWIDPRLDVVGVECAGAFKNVISICAGMVHGLGFSYGAETHLISRMAAEAEEFSVQALGADRATFSMASQCWGNDLWMSCTGKTRNRALGKLLGRGMSLDEAAEEMSSRHKTVEGVQTIRAMESLLADHPQMLSLFRVAEGIILEGKAPATLIDALMGSGEPPAVMSDS